MCFYWFSAVVSRAFFAIAGALLLLLQLGCKLNKIYFCLQLSTHFSFVILLLCCTFPFKQSLPSLPLLLFFANISLYGFPWKLLHSSSSNSSVAASSSMENQTVALSLSLETCCQLALFTVVVCVVVVIVLVASVATVVIVAAFLRKSFNVTFCLDQHKKLFYFPISCLPPFSFSLSFFP